MVSPPPPPGGGDVEPSFGDSPPWGGGGGRRPWRGDGHGGGGYSLFAVSFAKVKRAYDMSLRISSFFAFVV